MDADYFFADDPQALAIHRAVDAAVASIGEAEVRVSKSQVGFYRKHPFAATWRPAQYLSSAGAPLTLSIYLKRRDDAPRWKEVVQPSPGRFTHHVELQSPGDVDEFIAKRLREAWAEAG